MSDTLIPFTLQHAPALIEHLLPVQKLSAEAYKEQMAGSGKTLTALGSYWKGRKPLILVKACVLGCLLPATGDLKRDLEIFEMLMGMDMRALEARLEEKNSKAGRFILAQHRSVTSNAPYRTWVEQSARPEECGDDLFEPVWDAVNAHLGTHARTFPELVEQLGLLRYGHRPRLADTFCGSGQIPFEAARLGCDVFASDLNPVACMLTWGAFNIVGGSAESRVVLKQQQQDLVAKVQAEIDALGVETDGHGWRGKIYMYCLEVTCPQTGWLVPLLTNRVINQVRRVIVELKPDYANKRYDILVRTGVTESEMTFAQQNGTVQSDGRGQESYVVHTVDGKEYRTKLSTLRGDYRTPEGNYSNKLRVWEKTDYKPEVDDIFGERLYAIQWMRPKSNGRSELYDIRGVTEADLERECVVEKFMGQHLTQWQEKGWLPDLRIEPGEKTDEPIRTRGWTYWHHLFNARQLLVAGLINQFSTAPLKLGFARMLNCNSRLSRFTNGGSGAGMVAGVFDNQALNTLLNYGCRSTSSSTTLN